MEHAWRSAAEIARRTGTAGQHQTCRGRDSAADQPILQNLQPLRVRLTFGAGVGLFPPAPRS
ncbi:hypothetical protein KKY_634 [Pelagibacterium halotolerans B2]|uniref:Uncharacterized protein n=1 Tax=Pelagibacterium halotolerans (strain DSM 22347 / JCM 15775 / CGMCC 1.7692 / B2) TaxID=1082931 RepID=G4RCK1_PELHB|nr:hypothetical protein KKY_634 [Pelagibacterium halotolerans B2]